MDLQPKDGDLSMFIIVSLNSSILVVRTYLSSCLTLTNGHSIVRLIPLSEWCGVDEDYTVLDKRLCSDELVITGVIYYINNPSFSCTVLAGPRKIAVVQSQGTSLKVTTTNTDSPYSSNTNLHC